MTTSEDEALIEIEGAHKFFGRRAALQGVDLKIGRGRIVGLLGANGSGKTTLMRHMIGHCLPDKGRCRTFGCDTAKLGDQELMRIGYVHQEGRLLGWLKVRAMIDYVASYYSTWDRELERRMIELSELPLDALVGSLSPGQRQRLAVLLALCFQAELLILDEPAAGMDPLARARFLDLLLEQIQNENRTIIISSHILSDVEKVVDHVALLAEGLVLRDCSLDDLRGEFTRVLIASGGAELPERLPIGDVVWERRSDRQAELVVRRLKPSALESFARETGFEVQTNCVSLEDSYRHAVENPEFRTEA